MGMNYRTLNKEINKMSKGDACYINAINLSLNSIYALRKAIQNNILIPDINELKKYIIEDAIENYMNGTCICPQMIYIKQ